MAGWNATGVTVTQSKSNTVQCIGQKDFVYKSEEGKWPSVDINTLVMFFAKVENTVTTISGLTHDGAVAKLSDAKSEWEKFDKQVYSGLGGTFYCSMPYEKYSKTISMRRVDASGQYAVEISETTTTPIK